MKLKDYIQGKRCGKEANQLEREALDDPFLQDAIDGFDAVDGDHWHAVESLEEELTRRIKLKEKPENNRRWLIGIAASILLIIGFGSLFYFNAPRPEIAMLDIVPENEEMYSAHEPEDRDSLSDSKQVIAEVTPPPPYAIKFTEFVINVDCNMDRSPDVVQDEALAVEFTDKYVLSEEPEEEKTQAEIKNKKEAENIIDFGEKEFKEYVEKKCSKNICPEEKASIEVHFQIDDTGTPVNIKVEKSSCVELSEELIKLLENGPKWSSTKREVKLDIRLK